MARAKLILERLAILEAHIAPREQLSGGFLMIEVTATDPLEDRLIEAAEGAAEAAGWRRPKGRDAITAVVIEHPGEVGGPFEGVRWFFGVGPDQIVEGTVDRALLSQGETQG
jgi:hypothetical protein